MRGGEPGGGAGERPGVSRGREAGPGGGAGRRGRERPGVSPVPSAGCRVPGAGCRALDAGWGW
ncbi:hypothetical protein DDJ31_12340 [Streptomyces griseoviridis]|uniref:Uncharacterized protein n=1 Tax=Streptomyces griseoviridis TaxID=45398 RepID=A0ABX5TS50_STRGD|nr:hypothetical protein DDJ31_12340 [Streptomyces griseoviridis]